MDSGTMSSRRVISPTSRACERSVVRRHSRELHCSTLSARLAGYDDAACPYVLQVRDGYGIMHLGNMHACLGNT
jgi:hypothetical protein